MPPLTDPSLPPAAPVPADARTQELQSLGSPTAAAPTDTTPSAPAPSPSHPPPVSPLDFALLARFVALNESFPALAAELAASPLSTPHPTLSASPHLFDLYMWSARPEIAAWLAFHRAAADQEARTIAVNALKSLIVQPADDKATSAPPNTPIERRRAASTLLRAMDHNWPRDRRDRAPRSSPDPDRRANSRPPPEPELKPSITAELHHTPTDLASAIAADFRAEFSPQGLATIAAVVSPYGPIHDENLLDRRVRKFPPLSDQARVSDPVPFTPPRPLAEGRQVTINDPSTRTTLTLKFVRFTNYPWRLLDLNSS